MTSEGAKKADFGENEVKFLMSMRCWVYPFCYLPPDRKNCYRIRASGIKCEECVFRIDEKDKAEELYELYQKLMTKREERHYSFLKSEYWKKEIRPQILQYDNFTCVICKERNVGNLHVHHILDFSADDDLTPRNLVTLCNRCHSKLHPVFPVGMWNLGWPDLEKVKVELKSFYERVKETSENYRERFKAPLEHIMMHLCLVCPLLRQCDIGKSTEEMIMADMREYDLISLSMNKYSIAELRDGMRHVTVEGKIVQMGRPKEVETRYGKTSLVIALLTDDTGEIVLNLFGSQADGVECGDFIRVEKGYIVKYEGQLTLNVSRKYGRIVVNPKFTIPFPPRKVGRKGKRMEVICNICGKQFAYEYRGGPVKKYCEKCSHTPKIARKTQFITVTCFKCGSEFLYEYLGGPQRKYCDTCLKKRQVSEESIAREKLKKDIIEMYSQGIRPYKIAEKLGIKRNTLNYWLNKFFPNRRKWKRTHKN